MLENFQDCIEIQEKKKEVVFVFTSSTKREIKQFYAYSLWWIQTFS